MKRLTTKRSGSNDLKDAFNVACSDICENTFCEECPIQRAIDKLAKYEELEEHLQSVYGECDGLLEKVVEGLVKHEGVDFEKPIKSRLLTDDDVDKWDRLKGAMGRIVERLEELYAWNDSKKKEAYGEADWEEFNRYTERNTGVFIAIEIVKKELS